MKYSKFKEKTVSAGVVIIGAGQAGVSAAAELRKRKYDKPITLIGAETAPPYQRPPLSKAYLSGELGLERLWLKPEKFYQTNNITLRTGERITTIDRSASEVISQTGERLAYEHLILATGGEAFRIPIPGADLDGVHVLRNLAEADALSAAVEKTDRLVVIGAGYIGLEIAASCRKRGKDIIVLEAAERPMARTASELMGGFFGSVHRGYGVDLRVNTGCDEILGEDGKVTGVRVGAETIETELVLLATGLVPSTQLAQASGLECERGILVDGQARTSDPQIYAIGDVAQFDLPRYGISTQLESVQNAIEQGKLAATSICGDSQNYDPVPWFWSDQYELKLQIAGLIVGADSHVRRGDPEAGKFAIFHFKDKRLIACEAVNCAPEYMAAQRMIASGAEPDPERLRDESVAMKDFLT